MNSLKALTTTAPPAPAVLLARSALGLTRSHAWAPQVRTHASATSGSPTTDHILPPLSPTSPRSAAICFDIDGVLIQGGRVLPEARRALALVNGDNKRNAHVPHLYLTNGGGVTEEEKAHQLETKFGVPIRPDQVVLSHTPMRELANKFKDEWVLAVGARATNAKRVLSAYGFNKVVTPYQVYRWDKTIAPFCVAPEAVVAEHEPILDLEMVHFAAVLVVHDSRDWGTDLQIMCDVLRSPNGNLGAAFHGHARPASRTPGSRPTLDPEMLAAINRQHVPLYWSNPDLLWANEYPVPRFGQRGLRVALKAMWKEMTGTDLVYTSYGKPETNTYKYAFATLHRMFHDGREPAHPLDQETIANCVNDHFEVYAVGDNPLADIEGAHRHGWHGLLVRTGVYQSGQPLTVPTTKVLDNVEEAVKFVWERHYGEQH